MADPPTPLPSEPVPGRPVLGDQPPADDPQYHSLYRRFRPQRFDQVRGQDHVTRALRNAVRDDRVAHAYLFSGPRGTGKTSTARILAMALNCTNLQDGEPCGVCESCVEIRRGASVDVHELDAASNRRIDEMRDLLSRVALGTRGRWKVYIIDEVHQLTTDAASVLLKTLEEPPGHVVFVLATTDPQKVLPTIRSRTQHFEFHLLGSEVLGDLLRSVNSQAALGVAPEAIDLVVRRGHGSARDALTVLDQVAAAGVVEDEATVVSGIVDGLAERDAGRVLLAVAEGMASGRDPRRLAVDVLEHLRNGFLATMARSLVMLPDDAVARVEEQARQLGPATLVRAMEGIGEALAAMRDSVDPRVTLEVALVRLARPEADHSQAALLERVERLERAAARGGPPAAAAVPPAPPPAAPPPPSGGPDGRPPAAGQGPAPAGAGGSALGAAVPPAASGGSTPASAAKAALGAHRQAPGSRSPGPRAGGAGAPPPFPGTPAEAGPGASPAATGPAGTAPAAPPDAGPASAPRVPTPPVAQAGPAPAASGPAGTAPAAPVAGPGPAPRVPTAPPSRPGRAAPPVTDGPPAPPGRAGPAASQRAAAAPPGVAGPAPGPGVAPSAAGPLPSRDELTKAWGDGVLQSLSGKARSRFASGRFLSVEGGAAVFAVPDRHLLSRCEEARVDVEAALAARFGRTVPIRLTLDPGGPSPAGSDATASWGPPPDDLDDAALTEGFDDLEDAGPAVTSPEQRLLEAFPGAEEVSP